MVKTKFTPNKVTAMYDSKEVGISPMGILPQNIKEIKEFIHLEEAQDESKGGRTEAEVLLRK